MPDFKTADERTEYIVKNADYFTVIRFLGQGQYERYEFPTLEEATSHAQKMANKINKVYGVYAVMGQADTWVRNLIPEEK